MDNFYQVIAKIEPWSREVRMGNRQNGKRSTPKSYKLCKIDVDIGVDLYTFVGARAPTMLSWAPPKVLWAPTTKVGTGITVTVL